jgi:hypothetical protein
MRGSASCQDGQLVKFANNGPRNSSRESQLHCDFFRAVPLWSAIPGLLIVPSLCFSFAKRVPTLSTAPKPQNVRDAAWPGMSYVMSTEDGLSVSPPRESVTWSSSSRVNGRLLNCVFEFRIHLFSPEIVDQSAGVAYSSESHFLMEATPTSISFRDGEQAKFVHYWECHWIC